VRGQKVRFWFTTAQHRQGQLVEWAPTARAGDMSVRLGVTTDTADPLVRGRARLAQPERHPDVHRDLGPPGGDCNDQAFCQRTRSSPRGAPPLRRRATQTEAVVDELWAWFGPTMWLTFNV
jgi:hypothetical protein